MRYVQTSASAAEKDNLMPLHVDWHVPLRAIDARCWGTVTLEEADHLAARLAELLQEAYDHAPTRTLYLLFDTLEADSLPPLYRILKPAIPLLKFKNRGPMYHVTRNRKIHSIIDLMANVTRFQAHAFNTREEAVSALALQLERDDLLVRG